MTDEQVERFLWADVLRLALSAGSGRVEHTGILAAGCRAALVIDAVEREIITRTDGQLQFGTDAVDAGLLTDLVGEFKDHPSRTLGQVFQRGRPHLSAFIDELVASHVWQRHGVALGADYSQYRDTEADRFQQMRSELIGPAAQAFSASSPHRAALACLAEVLNLQTGSHRNLHEPAQQIIDACGPLSWIVQEVTAYLLDAQQTDLAAGRADGLTNSTQLLTS